LDQLPPYDPETIADRQKRLKTKEKEKKKKEKKKKEKKKEPLPKKRKRRNVEVGDIESSGEASESDNDDGDWADFAVHRNEDEDYQIMESRSAKARQTKPPGEGGAPRSKSKKESKVTSVIVCDSYLI
jgi:hypothetical protein